MSKILKGNYQAPEVTETKKDEENKDEVLKDEFEAANLQKLGGSIAFVKKPGSSFVWDGKSDKKKEDKKDE